MNPQLVGRRVLIVEDEVMVAWMLEDMLQDLGCTLVGPAARINQALAMVAEEIIDAVVLDISLNGELSYPIADALLSRGIPFLFSTGYARDRLHEGYRTLPTLQKPFYRAELENVLVAILPTVQLECQLEQPRADFQRRASWMTRAG